MGNDGSTFHFDSRAAANALGFVLRAIVRSKTMPILGSVLCDVRDGRLSFTGTDLDVWASDGVPVDPTSCRASFVLDDAREAKKILAVLPDDRASLEVRAGVIVLSSGRFRTILGSTSAPHDFPCRPLLKGASVVEVQELVTAFTSVLPFVSTDPTRPSMYGVAVGDGGIVATDGRALCFAPIPGFVDAPAVLWSVGTAPLVSGMVGTVQLVSVDDRIGITDGSGRSVVSRLTGDRPPSWRDLVSRMNPTTIVCGRDDVLKACALAVAACDPRVGIRWSEGDTVFLAGTRSSSGLSCFAEGASFDVFVNPALLAMAVRAVVANRVKIEVREPLAPIRIQSASHDDGVVVFVMPMRP